MKARVQSFQIVDWCGIQLSPLLLAKQGYKCVAPARVQCEGCGIELDFSYLQFNHDEAARARGEIEAASSHLLSCLPPDSVLTQWKSEGVYDLR